LRIRATTAAAGDVLTDPNYLPADPPNLLHDDPAVASWFAFKAPACLWLAIFIGRPVSN